MKNFLQITYTTHWFLARDAAIPSRS